MPTGLEPTMGLLIKALESDQGMLGIFQGARATDGIVQVYRDEVPATVSYPFLFLAEDDESEELRDSETLLGGDAATRVERLIVHAVAMGSGGTLPWAIVERMRNLLVDREPEPSPYLTPATANDPTDVYDIRITAESRQNLLPTMFTDDMGRKLYQSTQSFLLTSLKKGAI